jgi:hypothetical protein
MLSLEYDHEVESTRNPCVRDNSQRYLRFPPNILNVEKQLYITVKSRPYHYPQKGNLHFLWILAVSVRLHLLPLQGWSLDIYLNLLLSLLFCKRYLIIDLFA